jgi:hypothetical protein
MDGVVRASAGGRVKLGIVIQHYDARNDVRELVDLLAKSTRSCCSPRPASCVTSKRVARSGRSASECG